MKRLYGLPAICILIFLGLLACFQPDQDNLITWLQGPSRFPELKFVGAVILVLAVLIVLGSLIAFVIIRPAMAVFAAGATFGVCCLIHIGFQASGHVPNPWHLPFFMLALVLSIAIFAFGHDGLGRKRGGEA